MNLNQGLLLTVTIRVIDAVGDILHKILWEQGNKITSKNERLNALRVILFQVLETVLPTLTSIKLQGAEVADSIHASRSWEDEDPIDIVVERVFVRIFQPIIRSFDVSSNDWIIQLPTTNPNTFDDEISSTTNTGTQASIQNYQPEEIFTVKNQRQQQPQDQPLPAAKSESVGMAADIRNKVFSLFQTIVKVLKDRTSPRLGLAPALALDAIRRLDNVMWEGKLDTVHCPRPVWEGAVETDEELARSNKIFSGVGGSDVGIGADGVHSRGDSASGLGMDVERGRVRAGSDLAVQGVYRAAGMTRRVKKLARKEAVWYLCATLHVLCPGRWFVFWSENCFVAGRT